MQHLDHDLVFVSMDGEGVVDFVKNVRRLGKSAQPAFPLRVSGSQKPQNLLAAARIMRMQDCVQIRVVNRG